MKSEINSAVKFLLGLVRGQRRIADDKLDLFQQTLVSTLTSHYEGHWFPRQPTKGSAYRCIQITDGIPDKLLQRASVQSGIDHVELGAVLPTNLTLWVDPDEVSYRIGEDGSVGVVYETSSSSTREQHETIQVSSTSSTSRNIPPTVQAVTEVQKPSTNQLSKARRTQSPVSAVQKDTRTNNSLSARQSSVSDLQTDTLTSNSLYVTPVFNYLFNLHKEQSLHWRFQPLYVTS